MSDIINSLPVPPEFVEALQETVVKAVNEYLKKTRAPEEITLLVDSIFSLGYYVTECYRNPEGFAGERADRYDIEAVVLEAVSAVGKVGGEFYGPDGGIGLRKVVKGRK